MQKIKSKNSKTNMKEDMKRIILLLCVLLVFCYCTNGDEPKIKPEARNTIILTSDFAIYWFPRIAWQMAGYGTVTIDWGDGTEVETHYLTEDWGGGSNPDRNFYRLYSDAAVRTITIKGDSITHFRCGQNLRSAEINGSTLMHLDLRSNLTLTSLNIINAPNLTYLDVSSNRLTSLDLSNAPNLTTLLCTGNQLTSLDLSKNTKLVHLSCFNNRLTALDLSNNTALESLGLDNNQLTSLDLSNNIALRGVGVRFNNLTREALLALFDTLHGNEFEGHTKMILIMGNPGAGMSLDFMKVNGWLVLVTL